MLLLSLGVALSAGLSAAASPAYLGLSRAQCSNHHLFSIEASLNERQWVEMTKLFPVRAKLDDTFMVGPFETKDCLVNPSSFVKETALSSLFRNVEWIPLPSSSVDGMVLIGSHESAKGRSNSLAQTNLPVVSSIMNKFWLVDRTNTYVDEESFTIQMKLSTKPMRAVAKEDDILYKSLMTHVDENPDFFTVKNSAIDKLIGRVDGDEMYKTLVTLTSIHTRHSNSSDIYQAANYIESAYKSLGLKVTTQRYRNDYAYNILAELRGYGEPDKYIVLGAHYDSRSVDRNDVTVRAPGADDDGSGTANLLEMARVIVSSDIKFYYSIIFATFSGEEQGLFGSEAYAQKLADEKVQVLAMLNNDMIGYHAPGTPITLGFKDRSVTPWLVSVVKSLANLYVPGLAIADSSSCCSDYLSFFDAGFNAVGLFESKEGASNYPHYHTSTDTIDKLDFEQMEWISRAMLASCATFAVPM